MGERYTTFKDFYPFYLGEHRNRACRRMHFIGSTLVLLTLLGVFITGRWWWLLLMPLFGYGCAWMGHFFFEKNRPATFTHPLYSLMGDWVMYRDILIRRISL
ncbi:MAG TPA: DUF962 domain-containing protein [Gammaproteobacteria bacterium]|nr:DUF962 domain-containing protein [Gammaproteobacteria bacterium]